MNTPNIEFYTPTSLEDLSYETALQIYRPSSSDGDALVSVGEQKVKVKYIVECENGYLVHLDTQDPRVLFVPGYYVEQTPVFLPEILVLS